mgnify:CR=1 FL=1
MSEQLRRLMRYRLSDHAEAFREFAGSAAPRRGWVRAIPKAHGMSQAQLARRAGISRGTVQKLERAEASRRITLESLDRLAGALDCQLAVALVPHGGSLDALRERQADLKAEAILKPVEHSMKLEGQGVTGVNRERVKAGLKESLLRGSQRKLWQ